MWGGAKNFPPSFPRACGKGVLSSFSRSGITQQKAKFGILLKII
jgi:hypothetical protein